MQPKVRAAKQLTLLGRVDFVMSSACTMKEAQQEFVHSQPKPLW